MRRRSRHGHKRRKGHKGNERHSGKGTKVEAMVRASLPSAAFVSFVSFSAPLLAQAQTAELIGIRAQGMAGAFTAVADDSTATWWNPAGLADGPFLTSSIEYGRPKTPADTKIEGISMTFPALGVSYYRLPISQMRL